MRDRPVVFWLAALLIVVFIHPYLPIARWVMIHLLLLGAVTHSILVWSKYFADALLHTPFDPRDRPRQNRRLILLNGGVAAVISGMVVAFWPLTVAGAVAVVTAVVWHGAALAVQVKGSLSSRFAPTVHYYLAATAFLPVGVTLGAVLARGLADPLHSRLVIAHAAVNLLGWIGLTVCGTLMTLWPTMLRTRIVSGAEKAARRALPILTAAVAVTVTGSLLWSQWVAGVGLVGYLCGLAVIGKPFVLAARNSPPSTYATLSVLSGVAWLIGCLVASAAVLFTAPDWAAAGSGFGWLTPALAAGFAAQVLLGALSYLIPVVLRGGPAAVRAADDELDRGSTLRITVANLGLLLCMLPVPSFVRVICSLLVVIALAAFLPLMFRAIKVSLRVRKDPPPPPSREQRADAARSKSRRNTGLAAVGLGAVLLAVSTGVALDPVAVTAPNTASAAAGVTPTGETTRVEVSAKDMRFHPSVIDVPAGDRLVIELRNADDDTAHDLVLETGQGTARLDPGQSATLDVGAVGRDLDGWCSVVGHRQMGMVLDIEVTGTGGPNDDVSHDAHGGDAMASAAEDLDFMAEPGADFEARDARLGPAPDAEIHRRTFTVSEVERSVAVGVTQRLWTFNGTAPGPVLRGSVGDVFEITLVNDGSMGHSIDFHAGALAPDRPMRTLEPGESLTYRFTATRSGIWMYHCSTMPMSTHIANGMFGAVIIDPPDLPEVDREYVIVQSELYLGPQGGTVDAAKVRAEEPDAVVFNGFANQYDHDPIEAKVGERVRIWVLNAGPNRSTGFHVVGAQFDAVFVEGRYELRPDNGAMGGSQTLGLMASQGGFVELVFPEAGHYPFVSHRMIDAERGAHGVVEVTR